MSATDENQVNSCGHFSGTMNEPCPEKSPPEAEAIHSGPGTMSALALPIILLLAAAIRFIELGRESFWYDELYSAWARKLPLDKLVPEVLAAGHPPLFNVIGHFWNYLGESDFQVRSLSAACGVVTVWLVYLAGVELYSRRTGLWASALAAFSPFLVWYSREATSYSWLVMITTLSFLMLARCARRGGWKNWAGYVAATAVAFFTHFFAPVLLISGFTVYWLLRDAEKSGRKAWFISQTLLMFAVAVPLYFKKFVEIYTTYNYFPDLGGMARGLAAAPLSLAGGRIGVAITGGPGVFGLSKRALLALALGALFLAAATAFSKSVRTQLLTRQTIALALYTLMLVAGPIAMYSFLTGTPLACRYYVWAAPTFLLLLAVLLTAIPPRAGFVAGLIAMAAFFGLTLWGYSIENYDWRSVMQQIAGDRQTGDRVVCFPIHHCVVASSHYLSPAPDLKGGYLEYDKPDSAYFDSRGEVWTGYGYKGDYSLLSGVELENRVISDADGAGRIWLVAGDGLARDYAAALLITAILEKDGWEEAGSWHYEPLVVTLLVHRESSPATGAPVTSVGRFPT